MKSFAAPLALPGLWLLSFAASLMPLGGYEAHFFLASVLLLAAALVYALNQGSGEGRDLLRLFWLPGFIFWALCFASALTSEIPFISYIYFCFFSMLPLTFLLSIFARQKDDFYRVIAAGIAAIFAALGVFSFVQYFLLPDWLHNGVAHWPLADPNSLAGLFGMAFFCSLGWMLGAKNRLQSNAAMLLSLLFICSIFLTGSRGTLFMLALVLAVFAVFARVHIRKHWRCCLILAVGAAAVFILLGLHDAAAIKSPSATFGKDVDFGARAEIWAATWHIIRDHFWLGTGIGTFFLYYPAYRGADYNSAGFMAHNDVLQFWSEMGVAAPILLYLFLAAAGIKTVTALCRFSPADPGRLYILAPFCALGLMAAQAHINFPFNILPSLMLAGILLGFWHYQISMGKMPPEKMLRGSFAVHPYFKPALTVLLLVMVCAFAGLQGAEILVGRAQDEIAAGDLEGFSHDINAADRLSHNTNSNAYTLAATIPAGILTTQAKQLPAGEKRKLFDQTYKLLSRAQALNPRAAAPLYYKAELIQTAPEFAPPDETPQILFEQALAVDPLYTNARMALADILIKKNEKEKALAVLKSGLGWPNNTAESYQKTAFLALDLGDFPTHKEAMNRLLKYKRHELGIQLYDQLRKHTRE